MKKKKLKFITPFKLNFYFDTIFWKSFFLGVLKNGITIKYSYRNGGENKELR